MAGSLNRVFIIGNLGKDPDVKHFDNNGILARLAVATSESYTNRETNERVENTQWHTIVLRRGLAEIAEKYLKSHEIAKNRQKKSLRVQTHAARREI